MVGFAFVGEASFTAGMPRASSSRPGLIELLLVHQDSDPKIGRIVQGDSGLWRAVPQKARPPVACRLAGCPRQRR